MEFFGSGSSFHLDQLANELIHPYFNRSKQIAHFTEKFAKNLVDFVDFSNAGRRRQTQDLWLHRYSCKKFWCATVAATAAAATAVGIAVENYLHRDQGTHLVR